MKSVSSHLTSGLILLLFYCFSFAISLAPSELIALTDLQKEFSGVSSWTTPPDTACSSWDGIECNDFGHVVQLDLEIDEIPFLRYTIPSSIDGLSWLSYLAMTDCSLTGTIPLSICNISSLSTLMFQYNFLSGSIPACLGSLSLLQEFNLGNNRFTGSIPQSIWTLPMMEDMNIYNNQLSGPLPSFCSMPLVSNIDISGNQLSGSLPLYFPKLGLLDALGLNNNLFEGAIPPTYGYFNTSIFIDLSSNIGISGTIPATICDLPPGSGLQLNANNSIVPPYPPCCYQQPFDPTMVNCNT